MRVLAPKLTRGETGFGDFPQNFMVYIIIQLIKGRSSYFVYLCP